MTNDQQNHSLMHPNILLPSLMRNLQLIAVELHARKIIVVRVKLGVLAKITTEQFRKHFIQAATGTIAEGARLEVELISDIRHRHAGGLILENVELEE